MYDKIIGCKKKALKYRTVFLLVSCFYRNLKILKIHNTYNRLLHFFNKLSSSNFYKIQNNENTQTILLLKWLI